MCSSLIYLEYLYLGRRALVLHCIWHSQKALEMEAHWSIEYRPSRQSFGSAIAQVNLNLSHRPIISVSLGETKTTHMELEKGGQLLARRYGEVAKHVKISGPP